MQKYSSTGNTFAIFDNTRYSHNISDYNCWKKLARKEQVDGIIFLESSQHPDADFKMRYLNADGKEVDMCGNGARALGIFIRQEYPSVSLPYGIETGDGICEIVATHPLPCLHMPGGRDIDTLDISDLFPASLSLYLVCGVPHAIFFVTDVRDVNIAKVAPPIARHPRFSHGVNVNFVQILETGRIASRVYERGVERETLSCGTGASASAIACLRLLLWRDKIEILTPGGELTVRFSPQNHHLLLAGRVVRMEGTAP